MTRALVLGGGGPVGIAWETGLLAGLAENGVNLADADLIIGTSAGSAVGAQLAMGRQPQQMYAALAADAGNTRPGPTRQNTGEGGAAPNLMPLMELMQKAAAGGDPVEIRKEIGKFALEAKTMGEEDFIATFGRMLASAESWPSRQYMCTAVDALTGEFQTWGNDSNVPLSRAVASSCSVPGIYPPITINGRRYIDGGMRSATNADLVKGYDQVVVVAVTSGAAQGPMAEAARKRFEAEMETVRESNASVSLIGPDAASVEAFGLNLMDFTRRAGAAEAGLSQGKAEASRIAW